MKVVASILILALLFFSPPSIVLAASYTDVTVSEAKTMIESNPSLVVLDVRAQSEYDSGHIRNAKLIPSLELGGRLDELDKADEILVYCRSGGRSSAASQLLVDNGFLYVYNMVGGTIAWINEGYPVYVKYYSIQEAINIAGEGDTIFVSSGTYYEHVVVDKAVSLIGENRTNTTIDGDKTGSVVYVVANNTSINDFTIQNSGALLSDSGIYVNCSKGNNISHNIITNNFFGVWLNDSVDNTVSSNIVSNNVEGIWLSYSGNNTFFNNNMTDNIHNFGVWGNTDSHFDNSVDTSNTVDDKPIYYLKGVTDTVYDAKTNAGTLYLINCNNITIKDLTLTNNGYGVFLWNTTNSKIENVTTSYNYAGIHVGNSSYNAVYGNTFSLNIYYGIQLSSSNNNTVSGNTILNNTGEMGLYDGHGIRLDYSNNNVVTGNTVSNNDCGIRLSSSCNNVIFHNNVVDNTQQVHNDASSCANFWDDGYPSGGNHWSDHEFIDEYSGSNQDQPGSDGICDTSYVIDENNQDNYPLMNPWTPLEIHDVIVVDVVPSKNVVGQDYSMSINAIVENQGDFTETFNITAYANETVIDIEETTLASRDSTVITFTWNTSGFSTGNYTVKAIADQVPGETDLEDNSLTDGWVIVAMVGDITGPEGVPDGKVDMRDVSAVAKLFGVNHPDPRYNPNCDVIYDLKVDMKDISVIAKEFGKTV